MSRAVVYWLLVGLYVFSALMSVGQVGKPRKPTTPGAAVVSLVIAALLIAGVTLLYRSAS